MNSNNILFIYTEYSTFVRTDFKILSKKFNIKKYQYQQSKKILKHLIEQLKLFIFLLKSIRTADAVYVWFGDYHSFLPIIFSYFFGKRSALVLGGYDVANIPELSYGAHTTKIRSFFTKNSIKYADINLCVSDNIAEDALKIEPMATVKILYTGYSPDKFVFNKDHNLRTNIVLTVASCHTLKRLKIKGIDKFVEYAKLLSDIEFVIIGVGNEIHKFFDIPANVTLIEAMPQKELIKYYQKSKIYAQFSVREGLPNAVCESMLCGCIPIGFNNGGIPIAIGDSGYIFEDKNPEVVTQVIKKLLLNNKDNQLLREKAKDRVTTKFSLKQRENTLNEIIHQLINK